MNSKNKLAVFGFTILATIIFKPLCAQPLINYTNNSTFNITTPAIDYQIFNGKTPYTKAFLETGSGAFFILPTTGYQQQPVSQTWYYKASGTPQSVAQLATYYDTIRRPPHASSMVINSMNTNGRNPIQNLLHADTNIIVTNAVNNSILPLDTMTIAITYKNIASPDELDLYHNSVIAFFYNNSGNSSLFRPIPTSDNITYDFNGTQVKPIRKHNGETVLTTLSGIPSSIQHLISNSNTGNYSNVLYLRPVYSFDGQEKNVFISLVSSSLANIQTANIGSYKAVLIDYNNSGSLSTVKTFEQNLVTNLTSHDPNYILTAPSCLDSTHPLTNRKIDYEIQFVNDGRANANLIKITATIPSGIQFPSNGRGLVTCMLGNDKIDVVGPGDLILVSEKYKRRCLVNLYPWKRQITFTIISAQLSFDPGLFGKNNVGKINFSLKTNPSGNIPQCMYSGVSIKFDNNMPVTDTCLTRVDCSHKCPPPRFNP